MIVDRNFVILQVDMKKCSMFKVKSLILLLFCCCFVAGRAQDSLCIKLDSLLRHPMFETSQVGLMVYDLTADSTLYQYQARQLLRPASTMKLLTAITALDCLGGDYLFSTRLHYTGEIVDSMLVGNVYCVGGFDPMVSDGDVNAMAANLRSLGVNSLQGYVIADLTMKDGLEYGEGWCWDDDNPTLTPLSVGRKDVFVERLLREMVYNGIMLNDVQTGDGRCPARAKLICQCHHSIDEILDRMMKKSDNFYAEALFYQIAASQGKLNAKAGDAREVVKRLIRKIGLDDGNYRIADGSGLSLYNYVTAELETMLLRYAWHKKEIRDHLLPSLPIAGVDGTLEKRMRKTPACGNVRAKTGTVTGISSLAGYCTAANGHDLAFCIINQGVLRGQLGRNFQDRVCAVLCE